MALRPDLERAERRTVAHPDERIAVSMTMAAVVALSDAAGRGLA